jgi:hypothetical protein
MNDLFGAESCAESQIRELVQGLVQLEEALTEWLTRIKHSIKPSMWQH